MKSSFLATKSVSQLSSTSAPPACGDQAGGGLALGAALGRLGGTLDAQQLDGLVEVAVGLLERLLAVHHPGAGRSRSFLTSAAVKLAMSVLRLPVSVGAGRAARLVSGPAPSAASSARLGARRSAAARRSGLGRGLAAALGGLLGRGLGGRLLGGRPRRPAPRPRSSAAGSSARPRLRLLGTASAAGSSAASVAAPVASEAASPASAARRGGLGGLLGVAAEQLALPLGQRLLGADAPRRRRRRP